MKVCKFGGSSLANAAQISKVADIILADDERRIAVVSAPGKRSADDIKVTDLLIRAGEATLAGGDGRADIDEVVARFAEIQESLGLPADVVDTIRSDLLERLQADTAHRERYMDALKAAGEDNCAKLVAAELQRRGVDARYANPREAGMLLSDEYGNARLLQESYERLGALKDLEYLVVFPGFFGYTREGHVATFSRGGSDITGSILAAAVHADIYENFTDVDSVFSVDPRIVPNAAPIEELTYREMRELAYAGFSVLHDEAVQPAIKAGVPIEIRNTNAPAAEGTRIVSLHSSGKSRVVGIAGADGFCTIYVSKYLMNREIGFGRRLLQILEAEGISYEHTPSGIDNMSIIIRAEHLARASEERVLNRIKEDLEADTVEVEHGLALIMIVGEGMRYAVGIASKATAALADVGVSIEMMNQGSSEISMMFGVKEKDRAKALASLYATFFENR